ncbi:MAG: glycyl-radical enzyme activating protein [Clostridia bacterium]|nr:glycyl-radical enzyme activating protein [Clostridia bacterium]
MSTVKLRVTEIQRFCMHDGPGVRTTVFLKGCPLRCEWCHNPETQKAASELLFYENKCILCQSCAEVCRNQAHTVSSSHLIDRSICRSCFSCTDNCPTGALEVCGREMTVEQILSEVEKDRAFYGQNGGVTLSGGEPLMQKEVLPLLKACKANNLTTVVETCGYADTDLLTAASAYVDLFLWDIKDTDPERHRRYTGVSNEKIIQNLRTADAAGVPTVIRSILVSGVNTERDHYLRLADLSLGLKHTKGVELIPYHAYGGSKATFLGGRDNGRTDWIPSASELELAREVLCEKGVNIVSTAKNF